MSKINKEQVVYTNDCIHDCDYIFIARPCDPGNTNTRVVMIEITEKDEQKLDNGLRLSITKGGLSFHIDPEYCYAWGELDLSPDSDDINKIKDANWFNKLNITIFMPSEYDYYTHTVTSNLKRGNWYETDRPEVFLPYLYACLNKPKRVAIFKEYIDYYSIARQKHRKEKDKNNYLVNRDKIKAHTSNYRKNLITAKKLDRLSKLNIKLKI